MVNKIKATVLARPDVLEFFEQLSSGNVRYLLFGGCAVLYYAGIRYTNNVDLWVSREPHNIGALLRVLKSFHAPLAGLDEEDFCKEGHFYQMGIPPVRIDDVLSTVGISFEEAWRERRMMRLDGLRIPVISRQHLIKSKLAAGRSQDIIDAKSLERRYRRMK